jgi:hypothetical protein
VEGLLLPGAPPSRAYLLGSEGHFIVVGTYTDSPITVSLAEQKQRLYASVDPISPPQLGRVDLRRWWRRRVPPPGPSRLLHARLSP